VIILFSSLMTMGGAPSGSERRKMSSSDPAPPPVVCIDLENTIAPLYGTVFSSGPMLLVPAKGWTRDAAQKKWRMASPSTLVIHVRSRPAAPLEVFLKTENRMPGGPLRARLNGADLPMPAVDAENRLIRITVPAEPLPPGTHELTLRLPETVSGETAGSGGLVLKRMRYRLGEEFYKIAAESRRNDGPILNFLTRGLFGSPATTDKLSGFLFDGPREIRLRLSLREPAALLLSPFNRSGADAEFYIAAGDRRYALYTAPEETKAFTLPLRRGRHDLRLGVRGAPGGLFLWGAPYLTFEPPPPGTPVVLVTLDTTRRDAVAPYHGVEGRTPALQAFSESATVYMRAHATSPWTVPSHASIFTGLYPSGHQAGVSNLNLDYRFDTLAERLRARGYFTGGAAGGTLLSASRCLGQGFSVYRDPDDKITRADRMTQYGQAFLETHRDKPFFLFLNYFDPHFPYRAPPDLRGRFGVDRLMAGLADYPRWQKALAGKASLMLKLLNASGRVPEPVREALSAAYHAEVAFMDRELGRLFDTLKRLDLYDRALIAVVSDHGEYLGEGGRIFHSFRLEEALTHIPFLVKWPGQKRPVVVNHRVSLVDLFATILDAAGIPVPEQDGLVLGKDDAAFEARDAVLLEEHGRKGVHNLQPGVMKISDELYGMVFEDRMVTAWEGGNQCHAWSGRGWTETDCGQPWPEDMARVRRYFRTAADRGDQTAEALSEAEIEALRQLGYLN
jgi:arylsulfatase A-like enzyme